jgi:hypothetical protein
MTVMSWKLVVTLSLFGLAMGVATVFVIPSNVEPVFWLAIFLVCAWIIAKRAPGKYFLHGLCVSLVNSVWITAAHVIFFDTYLAHHAAEAKMMTSMPLGGRAMMLVTGPVVGLVSGLVLGLFAFVAGKIVSPAAKSTS